MRGLDDLKGEDLLKIADKQFKSRLLHCFGTCPEHKLIPSLAANLIKATGTNFLTIYTNGKNPHKLEDFPIGYAGLTYRDIQSLTDLSDKTLLINTNHAGSAKEAVEKSRRASEVTGTDWIKLEVLANRGKRPINYEVIKAAQELVKDNYIVLPIITKNLDDAKELEDIGCAAIRVLVNDIGSMKGMDCPRFFEELKRITHLPIIAEGGIGDARDAYKIMKTGVDGILVNTALFEYGNIIEIAHRMRKATYQGRLEYITRST